MMSPNTEDYYMILEVVPTAPIEVIRQSYKRLALKLHPDRNATHDTTEAFQTLGRAYETLKDKDERRAYDLLYPSILRNCQPRSTRPSQPPTGPSQPTEAYREAVQIAALQKSKQERETQWRAKKKALDHLILELQSGIQRLEQEIKNLDSIVAAETAEEARKNGWKAWLMSPIYQEVVYSEEEKARRDRGRQERKIEKDMKERRLDLKNADLKKLKSSLTETKEQMDAADLIDTKNIQKIRDEVSAREAWERYQKERVESERIAKIRRQEQEQQEKWVREMAETLRKNRAAATAAAAAAAAAADVSTCYHDGWWAKVQGHVACPQCYGIWTYLLQCPTCMMKACPKCQGVMRRRNPRNARTHR